MFKKFIVTVFAFIAVLGSISPALSQQIVVPPQFTNQNDFGALSIFDCADLPNGIRTQVLFPANDLIAGTISGTALRLFDGSPGFGPTSVPNVTFILSTYTNPGPLSTVFDSNTGADAVTVFAGTANIPGEPGCNVNPCPFGQPLVFQTPFEYDPANGDLLLEAIIPACIGGVPSNVLIDSTGVLDGVFAFDSTAGQGDNGFGNITEIIYLNTTNVPTLSEWGLIAMAGILGIVGFLVIRRRKVVA